MCWEGELGPREKPLCKSSPHWQQRFRWRGKMPHLTPETPSSRRILLALWLGIRPRSSKCLQLGIPPSWFAMGVFQICLEDLIFTNLPRNFVKSWQRTRESIIFGLMGRLLDLELELNLESRTGADIKTCSADVQWTPDTIICSQILIHCKTILEPSSSLTMRYRSEFETNLWPKPFPAAHNQLHNKDNQDESSTPDCPFVFCFYLSSLSFDHLSLSVDANDSIGWLMLGCHEDCVSADPE